MKPTELKNAAENYRLPSTAWPSRSCATHALVLDFRAAGGGAFLLEAAWFHAFYEVAGLQFGKTGLKILKNTTKLSRC